MKLIFIITMFSLGAYNAAPDAGGEMTAVVKAAEYEVRSWSLLYACTFPHPPTRCEWTKDDQPIDPRQYGFEYEGERQCAIRADAGHVKQVRGITCAGYFNYNNTIIDAVIGKNLKLICSSKMAHTTCVWKRNGKLMNIHGRYSYVYDAIRTQDCTIRIDSAGNEDFGQWTCSYFSENDQIIKSYTVNNGTLPSQNSTSTVSVEQQRIAKKSHPYVSAWSHTYTCDFAHPHHCSWLRLKEAFDPIKSGYHYTSDDHCNIRNDEHLVDQLHDTHGDILCVVHLNYESRIIANSWLIVVVVLSVSASVFLAIIVGLICKKKCLRLLFVKKNSMRHGAAVRTKLPPPTTTTDEVTYGGDNQPQLPLDLFNTIRNEMVDSNGYLRMKETPIKDNHPTDAMTCIAKERELPVPPNNSADEVEIEESDGYERVDPRPSLNDNQSQKANSGNYDGISLID